MSVKNLGPKIRNVRRHLNLNQFVFGRRLGIKGEYSSVTSILSKIENGRISPIFFHRTPDVYQRILEEIEQLDKNIEGKLNTEKEIVKSYTGIDTTVDAVLEPKPKLFDPDFVLEFPKNKSQWFIFGKIVRDLRSRFNISQTLFADKIGLSHHWANKKQTIVSMIENGVKNNYFTQSIFEKIKELYDHREAIVEDNNISPIHRMKMRSVDRVKKIGDIKVKKNTLPPAINDTKENIDDTKNQKSHNINIDIPKDKNGQIQITLNLNINFV